MHILRYLVFFTVVFLATCVAYQYVGQEDIHSTEENSTLPEVFVQMGHPLTVDNMAFSHDHRTVLSFSMISFEFKLWDIESGREIQTFSLDLEEHLNLMNQLDKKGESNENIQQVFKDMISHVIHQLKDMAIVRKVLEGQSFDPIALSFDGHILAVPTSLFSDDNTITLWNIDSERKIQVLTGHSKSVETTTFSPDGHTLLSGSADNTIKLWDVSSGREIHTMKGHQDTVIAVNFSPDGRTMLSGSADNTIKLWNVATGREIKTLKGLSGEVFIVKFSPDGRNVLSASKDNTVSKYPTTIKLWDVATGQEIKTLQHFSYDNVIAIGFSQDSKAVWWGRNNRYGYDMGESIVRLINIENEREIRSFKLAGYSSPVYAVTFSSNSNNALSASLVNGSEGMGNRITIWDVINGQKIASFEGEGYAMSVSPDSRTVLLGDRSHKDGILRQWDIKSEQEIHRLDSNFGSGFSAVSFSPDGRTALASINDLKWELEESYYIEVIKLYDVASGQIKREFIGHSEDVRSIAFSPDGHTALSGSDDNDVKLWDIATGSEIYTFHGHSKSVNVVSFSPDGRTALSGSDDHTVKLWDTTTGHEIHTFHGHSGKVIAVGFSHDGSTILSGSFDNTVKQWNIESKREIDSFQIHGHANHNPLLDDILLLPTFALSFSPDGSTALSSGSEGSLRLWNVQTGKEIAQFVPFKDGEWITITPEGYYQASLNGAKYLNVRVGNQVYGIDQYEAIYHRPDIVKLALKLGDSQQAVAQLTRNAPPIQIAQVQPPKVWFVAPQQGYETQRSSIEVKIETKEFVDSAESVTFKVNSRPVGREKGKRDRAKVAGVKTQSYRRQVPLQIGENQIEAEVRGKAGAVQRTSILVIRKGKDIKRPDLYFLGIGVATHPTLSLQYPAKDVTQLAKTFKQQRGRAYNQVFIKTLTDQQATRINLIQAITTFFKDVKQSDIAIVYVSGHGMNTSMGYHFLTYDANPDSLEATGASWQTFDAIYDLPAHVFLWVDTCRAGNIVGNTDWKARAQEARPDIFLRDANNRGVIVFASSSGSDVSQEDKRWGHSAFAKALLDGLNGEAADKKGRVPFDMLRRHVLESVEEMTDGLQKPTIPRITGTGAFLDLVLAKK